MNTSTAIKEFITLELFQDNSVGPIEDDTPLIDNGIIDSLGVMKLISHLEYQFGISISPDDLVPENFETVNLITKLVSSKMERG